MVVELLHLLVDSGLVVVEVPQDHHMMVQLEYQDRGSACSLSSV